MEDMAAAYARAESRLPERLRALVFQDHVSPHWDEGGSRFWYAARIREGMRYWEVDPPTRRKAPLFDTAALAGALSSAGAEGADPKNLRIRHLRVTAGVLEFRHGGKSWSCSRDLSTCQTIDRTPDHPRGARVSPDGQWSVYVKDHDLMLHRRGAGQDRRLTRDGERKNHYGTWLPHVNSMIRQQTEDPELWVDAKWSADSKRFVTTQIDWREALELTLVQATPADGSNRPRAFRYPYALPGDTKLAKQRPVVFEVGGSGARERKLRAPEIPIRYDDDGPRFVFSGDGSKLRYLEYGRGNTEAWLREIDVRTGKARVVWTEESDTTVVPRELRFDFLDERGEFILSSQRDGWTHLYLHDAKSGAVKRQITRGEYVVHRLVHVDEERGMVFFTAGGKEAGRDPYLRHLYKVDLRGGEPTLLTPEPADHGVSFSPDGKYFVDNYSRADLPPVSVLRDSRDGQVVVELEQADIKDLQASGWQPPVPFRAKGRDGETDIFGIIYRPSNFDPDRKYPVIENIYSGPAGVNVPKRFSAYRNGSQSIAELGFVVVIIDGMGTGKRSKKFQDVGARNLADGGFPDRIAVIEQLGERYPYLDVSRVGIYGFSAGGYNAARAILAHGDFYKVAVSASGNHDHRLDKADWNEKWMGYPVAENYAAQSNYAIAHQLEGKLLLAYGEVDHNVPPSASVRLVDALIQANKDFDLIILPNEAHYLEEHPYFIRRRWDYFVEHLLGVEPPAYRVGNEAPAR